MITIINNATFHSTTGISTAYATKYWSIPTGSEVTITYYTVNGGPSMVYLTSVTTIYNNDYREYLATIPFILELEEVKKLVVPNTELAKELYGQ